ncbi:MAG TPA: 2-oxo acid dehydrogenase subunit E2 [Gemmatimonadaceae bacterium]|nr:2-oxo acid dehydrogenase subunit E2 [Gemmatimonadaceae bacterium]
MATKIVMEALSPTMEEGRLVKWIKNEGDPIHSGDVLAEVETDKAVMELVARGDGVLRKHVVQDGNTAPVGTLLGVIGAADENIDALLGGSGSAASAPGTSTPTASVSGAPSAVSTAGAPTPAASASASAAQASGQSTSANADKASTHMSSIPGTPAMSQGEASTPPQEHERRGQERVNTASVTVSAQNGAGAPATGRPRSSPLARRLASERGVQLDTLQGSGPGGRIVKRDVEEAVQTPHTTGPAPRPKREGDYQDVPLTLIRKTIAKRLVESIGPIPTFYLTAEYDVSHIAELRSAMAELGTEYKVSFNDILIKVVATALAQHPEVNAHWLGDAIRQFNRVHIGMAVAIEDGLITPVIFDADTKGLAAIASEARTLAGKARERKLTPEQYTGSTFSISNLGMFGIDQFTAIINPPEAGILAIGAVEDKPVVIDGELAVRKRLRVTMSCDHRVIDGATGAKFLQTLRQLLENPLMLVY